MFLETNKRQHKLKGWVEVVCGSMFSGKTEELIRRLKRAKIANLNVEIFKPSLDIRYSKDEIVSHDSNSITSHPINNSKEILEYVDNHPDIDVIGVDEAQFFDDGIVNVCNMLADDLGIRVIVAGLDMDFQRKPFGSMPDLISSAEYVTKVHAICTECGDLASYSYRISNDKELVVLGEKESYKPLCRKCYIKLL